jgi:hypothetical protein
MIARPRTFLLDEHIPRKIRIFLQREGYNARWCTMWDWALSQIQPSSPMLVLIT